MIPILLKAISTCVSGFALEWIEIRGLQMKSLFSGVSGFALEWIEIVDLPSHAAYIRSPASRWSGLKYSSSLH